MAGVLGAVIGDNEPGRGERSDECGVQSLLSVLHW
jgi:hypothetical protein